MSLPSFWILVLILSLGLALEANHSNDVATFFAPTSSFPNCNISVATSTNPSTRSKCKVVDQGIDNVTVLQTELTLIATVTAACLNDTNYAANNSDPFNKYQIKYSVYNLLLPAAFAGLIKAFKAGVYVQVLIEASQVDPCRNYNDVIPSLLAGGMRVPCFAFDPDVTICGNESCTFDPVKCQVNDECVPAGQGQGFITSQLTVDDPTSLNLLPIMALNKYSTKDNSSNGFNGWADVGLMHTKMRLFDWQDSNGVNQSVLVTGSLNPDSSALQNDETLMITEDPDIIAEYKKIYEAVRTLGREDEQTYVNKKFDPTQEFNIFFSKGGVDGGPQLSEVLIDMIAEEREMVLVMVYTLRDFGGLTAALQKAADNGAFVAVLTDVDEIAGEPGFSAPDTKCSATCFNGVTLSKTFGNAKVPVYACKNANGLYSAFHHKNMVIGVNPIRVLSDTTNWSGSGAGTNYREPSPNCCTNSSQWAKETMEREERRRDAEAAERFYWTKNSQSPVGNCETAVFINSTSSKLPLQFVQNFFYLIEKYYTFTIENIDTITNPNGQIYFPKASFNDGRLEIPTGVSYPKEEIIPTVYTPKDIAQLMLKMPSLSNNADLRSLIQQYT